MPTREKLEQLKEFRRNILANAERLKRQGYENYIYQFVEVFMPAHRPIKIVRQPDPDPNLAERQKGHALMVDAYPDPNRLAAAAAQAVVVNGQVIIRHGQGINGEDENFYYKYYFGDNFVDPFSDPPERFNQDFMIVSHTAFGAPNADQNWNDKTTEDVVATKLRIILCNKQQPIYPCKIYIPISGGSHGCGILVEFTAQGYKITAENTFGVIKDGNFAPGFYAARLAQPVFQALTQMLEADGFRPDPAFVDQRSSQRVLQFDGNIQIVSGPCALANVAIAGRIKAQMELNPASKSRYVNVDQLFPDLIANIEQDNADLARDRNIPLERHRSRERGFWRGFLENLKQGIQNPAMKDGIAGLVFALPGAVAREALQGPALQWQHVPPQIPQPQRPQPQRPQPQRPQPQRPQPQRPQPIVQPSPAQTADTGAMFDYQIEGNKITVFSENKEVLGYLWENVLKPNNPTQVAGARWQTGQYFFEFTSNEPELIKALLQSAREAQPTRPPAAPQYRHP